MMWTGYSDENENVKIIIMLRKYKKQNKQTKQKVNKVTGLAWVLKAVHATLSPDFNKQRPLLEQRGNKET